MKSEKICITVALREAKGDEVADHDGLGVTSAASLAGHKHSIGGEFPEGAWTADLPTRNVDILSVGKEL